MNCAHIGQLSCLKSNRWEGTSVLNRLFQALLNFEGYYFFVENISGANLKVSRGKRNDGGVFVAAGKQHTSDALVHRVRFGGYQPLLLNVLKAT